MTSVESVDVDEVDVVFSKQEESESSPSVPVSDTVPVVLEEGETGNRVNENVTMHGIPQEQDGNGNADIECLELETKKSTATESEEGSSSVGNDSRKNPTEDSGNAQTPEERGKNQASDEKTLLNHKLRTIRTYLSLLGNKKNHTFMLKDVTVSGFLVLCLGDEDPQVVESSFEVFHSLSKHEENIPLIISLDYFKDALRCVVSNITIKDDVRSNAKTLMGKLKFSQPSSSKLHDRNQPLAELSNSMKNMIVTRTIGSTSASVDDKVPVPNSVDLNTSMSTMKRKNKGRETVLFIDGDVVQQKSERTKMTQALIGVKGIISVTYDLKKNYCVVRGKRQVAPEDFGRAVAGLGRAKIYIVRKNENKEEVKLLVANDKENFQYPPYPEEVEEVADHGAAIASKDQLDEEGKSFLKSAKNFLKRSFYW